MSANSGISNTGRRHAILGARARRLARPRGEPETNAFSCLVCEAGGGLYGLRLARLLRVAPFYKAAPTPSTNPALLGAIARAGSFYHVFDLAMLLGGRREATGESHAVLLRVGSPALALRVDRALRVAKLVALTGEAMSQMAVSHPAVTGFAKPVEDGLFDGRTIALVDVDFFASDAQRGRGEGEASVDQ